ncbi:hypothetical protein DFH11DRAFT_1745102 [Phellopilus nigrolimitatus]|nr:hypothetical protein DFH11DRAFT_1745102 [Phellopilus nigrolimitatus]
MYYIRSNVEPLDPSLVPLFITETDIEQCTQVAVLTLLVYDMCTFYFFIVITVDKEVKYFWNRYIGILGALSGIVFYTLQANETLCKSSDTVFQSLLIISKGLSFIWIENLANILLMRVLALYNQDKRLAACLRTLFGLEAACMLGLLIYLNIYEEIVVGELAKDITICGYNRNPPRLWGALSWVAPLLYAIILMVLALYKAAQHWRETGGFSQYTLVRVLIQDQAIYFIMVIFCTVMKIMSIELIIPNVLLADLLDVLGNPSLLCVLGSHLLVHLKEAGERGANGGTSYRMKTMSNIAFS